MADATKLLAALLVSYGLAAAGSHMHPVVPHQLLLGFLARVPDDLARLRCHPLLFLARLAREVDRYTLIRAVDWLHARLAGLHTLDDLMSLVQEHIVPSVALEPGALGYPTAGSKEQGGSAQSQRPEDPSHTVYSTYLAGTSLHNYGPDHLLWRPVEYSLPSLLHLPPGQVSADSACGRLVRLVLMDCLSTFSDLVRVCQSAVTDALPALAAVAEALRREPTATSAAPEVEAYIAATTAYARFQNKEWHAADRSARGIPHPAPPHSTSRRGATSGRASRRGSIVRVPSAVHPPSLAAAAASSSSSRSGSQSRDDALFDGSGGAMISSEDNTPDTTRMGARGVFESPLPQVHGQVAAAAAGRQGAAGEEGASDPLFGRGPGHPLGVGSSSGSGGSAADNSLLPRPFGPLGPYRRALWRVAGEHAHAKALLAAVPTKSGRHKVVELPVGWGGGGWGSGGLPAPAAVLVRVLAGVTLLCDKPPFAAAGGWSLLEAVRAQEDAAAAGAEAVLPAGTAVGPRAVSAAAEAGLSVADLFDPLLATALGAVLRDVSGLQQQDWAFFEAAVARALAHESGNEAAAMGSLLALSSAADAQQVTAHSVLDAGTLATLYRTAWNARPVPSEAIPSLPPPAPFLSPSSSPAPIVDYVAAIDAVRRARDLSYGMTLLRGKPVVGDEALAATDAAGATPLGAITDASAALRLLSLFGRGHELLVSAASAPAVSGTALGRPLLHYGLLHLGVVEAAAGHAQAAVEVLREGVRIAQSHGDAACVSLAQELLVDLEDGLADGTAAATTAKALVPSSLSTSTATRRSKVLGALHAYQRACCQSLWRQQTTAALCAVEEAVLLLAGASDTRHRPAPLLIQVPLRDWLSLDPAVSYRAGGHGVGAGVQGIHLLDADVVLQGDWNPAATRAPLLVAGGGVAASADEVDREVYSGTGPEDAGETSVLPFTLTPLPSTTAASASTQPSTPLSPSLSHATTAAMYPGSPPALAVAAGAAGGTGIPPTPLLYTSGSGGPTTGSSTVGVSGLAVAPQPTPLALTALASPTQAVLANAERRAQLLEVITNSVWGRAAGAGSSGAGGALAPPVPVAGSASIWSAPSPLSLEEAAALTARGHLSRAKQWEALGYPSLAKAAALCAAAAVAPPVPATAALPGQLPGPARPTDEAAVDALARLLHATST